MTEEVPMKNEVEAYLERPKRYENVDGTGEIFFGLVLYLGFALAVVLEGLLPAGSPRWAHLIIFAVLIPAFALGFWLRRFIKKHWTWKRTGYVAYRRDPRGRVWRILIAAAVAGAFVFAETHAGASLSRAGQWFVHPAIYAIWVFLAGREHLWKWLLLLVMVLGLVAFGLPVHGDFHQVDWQIFLFLGLVWIGSGAGTLFSYIRHTEPAESQAQ